MKKHRGNEQGSVSIEYVAVGIALTLILSVLAVSSVGASISQNFAYVFCKAAAVVDGRACAEVVYNNGDFKGDFIFGACSGGVMSD